MAHHCRDLAHSPCGVVSGVPASRAPGGLHREIADLEALYEACYGWLAERVGFWPVFLSIGGGPYARRHQTGYSGQWRVKLSDAGPPDRRYRRRGEFPSRVLFSWGTPPPGARFIDPSYWPIVFNSTDEHPDGTVTLRAVPPVYERLILKPGWAADRWIARARRRDGAVEAVVPELDLRTADEIWCRSSAAREALVSRGLAGARIRVVRVPVLPW